MIRAAVIDGHPAMRAGVEAILARTVDVAVVAATSGNLHEVEHTLYRTTPEGQSSLYMVGRYEDKFVKRSGAWRYAAHKVITDTRMLDTFTHIPV